MRVFAFPPPKRPARHIYETGFYGVDQRPAVGLRAERPFGPGDVLVESFDEPLAVQQEPAASIQRANVAPSRCRAS